MEYNLANCNRNNEKSENYFHNRDELRARKVYEQGVDPYLSEMNIYHANLYVSDMIENHGRELKHWSFLFSQYEQSDTKSIVDDYREYRESEGLEASVYHFSGRLKRINTSHIDNLRQNHKKARKLFTRYIRESSVECSMFEVHHKPIAINGEIIDIHFHAVFDKKPTELQIEFLNKRIDDLYCQPHGDVESLIRYMRKGIAKHEDLFSDENLAEYCRQMTYGGPLRRFGRLGKFREFSSTWNKIKNDAQKSPLRIRHTRIPDGEPVLCGIRLVWKNGKEIPTLIIRAEHFDESEYRKLEERYNLDEWRNYFLGDYYATDTDINTKSNLSENYMDDTATCKDLFSDIRQRE